MKKITLGDNLTQNQDNIGLERINCMEKQLQGDIEHQEQSEIPTSEAICFLYQ